MDQAQLGSLTNFIWNIADDILRDVYVRGKYRDVILPMTVLRRLDAVLEPTKQAVLDMKAALDREKVANQDDALRAASGQAFYNTSPFLLRDLRSRATQQQLKDDFETYLDGYSPNVQDILTNFEFRNQIPRLSKANALGPLIEKFLDKDVNLSPYPAGDLPALDNHSMGTIFEELVRRFNEENNEEAGEHWTPRDVVRLMANLMFLPIADQIESGTYLLYDCACGTGGMLTVAEETLKQIAAKRGKQIATHLYGQEINAETYAICKADLLLKGDGDEADNIVGGPEHSTLSADAYRSREFDFMLSNPPYGKSWKSDLERLGGKKDIKDPRFIVRLDDEDVSLVTRSSDGQMMFLANMLSKMKQNTALGSRIAEVHNGSSLFTGDAGRGESSVRRWILENDWLEAIVALPLNMFYNTGIATYVWVLTNRKSSNRKGKVQLIDATEWFSPLRKNMGEKNCELSQDDIRKICDSFLSIDEGTYSKVFENSEFGYWQVRVERPLRLNSRFTQKAIDNLRFASGDSAIRRSLYEEFGERLFENPASVRQDLERRLAEWGSNADDEQTDDEGNSASSVTTLSEPRKKKLLTEGTWLRDGKLFNVASRVLEVVGDKLYEDHNVFLVDVREALEKLRIDLSASEFKTIVNAVSWRVESAPAVIKKIHRSGKVAADPMRGRFAVEIEGANCIVEYEADAELRDFERVPLLEQGGIEAFINREVLPYTPDAWIVEADTKIGYEISFTRHFFRPPKLRTLSEISQDIVSLEHESEDLVSEITKGTSESVSKGFPA